MMTDPIADMMTRIRNASRVYKNSVSVPASGIKRRVAEILRAEGFIKDVKFLKEGPQGTLKITLKYSPTRVRAITGLRRVSRPGLRIYKGKGELPRVRGGLGIAILSTPHGLITDKHCRKLGVGGEVLCYVW